METDIGWSTTQYRHRGVVTRPIFKDTRRLTVEPADLSGPPGRLQSSTPLEPLHPHTHMSKRGADGFTITEQPLYFFSHLCKLCKLDIDGRNESFTELYLSLPGDVMLLTLGSSARGLGVSGFCTDLWCCAWNLREPLFQFGGNSSSLDICIDNQLSRCT